MPQGKEKLQLSPGGSIADRYSRWQKRAQSPSLAANVHRWNSMFDVASRSQSPNKKSDGAGSAYRRNRSRTPIILATSRRSTSPRLQSEHLGCRVSTSLTRSHSQHEVHSDSHDSTSTDNSTDLTFTESNADVTATTTTGDKNKAVGRKGHSYQSATKSSKAKSRFSTGNVKDLSGAGIGSSSRKSFGSKALSAGLKNKFKSTPDLMTIGDTNKENDGLSSSKTTEDLSDGEHLAEKDDQFLHTTQAQCNWKSPLLSAVATSCQGSASPTLSSSSGYMSATSSVTSKAGPAVPGTQPATTTSMASISSMVSVDDGDAGLMPPPPTTNVVTSRHAKSGGQSNGRRSTMTDLTLQQAKQILLGHPVTSDAAPNSSSSVRRRSTANEGTPSMLTKQRPHSALSGMMTATTPGPTTGSALSSQLEVKPMPRTMPTAISTSSFRMMLNSATLKSGAAVGTTASRDSMTVGHNDYLDDLPEKDTDSSTSSTKLSDEPVSMQNKTDLTATAATVISTIGTQKSPVGISQSSVLQSKPGEWDTKAKYEVKLTSSQEVRSRLTTSRVVGMSQSDTLNLVCMSDVVPGVKHDLPQGRSEMRKDEVKMEDDDSVTNSSKGVVDVTPPKCTESSNVGLARHRTPHVYNRTCMSPARQVINTNVGMQGHGMASAIRPPSIPAPLVPPRELASHSGSVVSPQRTLVQVNRDRQQVTPPRLVNHDAAPTTRIPALGEQELRQSSAFLSGSNILDPEANIFSPGGDEPGDDPDLEVKRPDKTQSSPPASLIADVTKDVTPSCVILTTPSTSQGGPGSHSGSVVGDFNLAFHRILAAYNAASQEAGSSSDSEEVKALRETLEQAQSDLIKVLGPPQPDFTPYLSQKDQNTTPPSTLTNRSTGPLRLRSDLANTEILNMLDYYSVHLSHLFKQKLDKSEGKE
ncbi:hypothetical protein LSH36_561g03086 [Paralvinella palmiformis]|uniref:Uncharacterized protein n=1 Tax=Paralvinella palmiformis TaxID=53620 RepID=A0AAD9J709_9ANNE|nr:hypothetical protein LSH36_561g03086 [Paralvinella palmiformis]